MNINEYLQQISLPNEYWTQVDDYNYWVSTRYRAVSSSKKQNALSTIVEILVLCQTLYFLALCKVKYNLRYIKELWRIVFIWLMRWCRMIESFIRLHIHVVKVYGVRTKDKIIQLRYGYIIIHNYGYNVTLNKAWFVQIQAIPDQ